MMTFWQFFTPSILRFRKRPSHEKDLEDPNLSESAIKNRVYCIVWYLSIVCSFKGTGLPSGCDIGLTDTFFLPHLDTFGRGQCCITTSRGRGQRCITIKVQRCIRYTLLIMFYILCLNNYLHTQSTSISTWFLRRSSTDRTSQVWSSGAGAGRFGFGHTTPSVLEIWKNGSMFIMMLSINLHWGWKLLEIKPAL